MSAECLINIAYFSIIFVDNNNVGCLEAICSRTDPADQGDTLGLSGQL